MNIAILGLGTVGYGVYDIIKKSNLDINIKYIFDKKQVEGENVTSDLNVILEDKEVDTVVECMGAGSFSYKCIKESLLSGKNVVTANKEVIAENIKELTKIKQEKNVSLYYEACVGGGVPIIKNLFNATSVNKVDSIVGILNGTTNFILTKMEKEGMEFASAIKLAQELGFAESDPTSDLEGLDMVRKIAILSSIAYKGEIDVDKIYHYGISTINKNDIQFAKENGYTIKLLATSKLQNKEASIKIEPCLVDLNSIISKVSDENNIISFEANYNSVLQFIGKGAGRYPTGNAMVNDLIMILNNDKNYTFNNESKIIIKPSKEKNKYYIRAKDITKINNEIIDKIINNQIITKEIEHKEIVEMLSNIYFYAKINK